MIRLGSSSPTRAKILKDHGIKFVQNGGNFDEDSITTTNPIEFVKQATKGKFNELFAKYGCDDMPLLVSDTVVTCEGKLLRKAKDLDDAKAMLNLQSNNKTTIITCMIFKSHDSYIFDISKTTYHFSSFSHDKLQEYLESGNYIAKAGAITVEDFCKPYIKSIDGYQSTAMGLCVEKLLPFVKL